MAPISAIHVPRRAGLRTDTTFTLDAPHAATVTVTVTHGDGTVDTAAASNGSGLWAATVPAAAGDRYQWIVDGAPVVDPCATAVADPDGQPVAVVAPAVTPTTSRPDIPWSQTVIYETHISDLTACHPGVPGGDRGTYRGAAHPDVLEHLCRLGVTTVEFLPLATYRSENHLRDGGRANHWGYNPLAPFAPHADYATDGDPVAAVVELRDMVDAYHAAGLEVIVDVVFNHTAEEGFGGPVWHLRRTTPWWYRSADGHDVDTTGCGNALNTADPGVHAWIVGCLRHWATSFGVDGFRFDLATTVGRDGTHTFRPDHPLLRALTGDPVLGQLKLIAEPWDIGWGGYQVGAFGSPWAEWNDRFRDDVRDFWRGQGFAGSFAGRLAGSADVLGARPVGETINFVTAHDGFTVADLVAYNAKHNDANGEANRDGCDTNRSWNCGAEGATGDPCIVELRGRQRRNLLASVLLAQGTPMLLGGDELGRTLGGNNNAYCQRSLSAYQWDSVDGDLVSFVTRTIGLRRALPALRHTERLVGPDAGGDVAWYTPAGTAMQPHDWHAGRCFTMVLDGPTPVAVVVNGADQDVTVTLPADALWITVLDTSAADGDPRDDAADRTRVVPGRSIVVAVPLVRR